GPGAGPVVQRRPEQNQQQDVGLVDDARDAEVFADLRDESVQSRPEFAFHGGLPGNRLSPHRQPRTRTPFKTTPYPPRCKMFASPRGYGGRSLGLSPPPASPVGATARR